MTFLNLFKRFGAKLLTVQQSDTKFVWMLVILSLLVLLNPFLPYLGLGQYLLNVLFTFVVLSSLLAARDERQVFRQLMAIGLITLVLDWLRTFVAQAVTGLGIAVLVLYILFFSIITVTTIWEVARSQTVTGNVICGAIAAYLLIGLMGALLATLLETLAPGTFLAGGEVIAPEAQFDTLLYYSLVTLSTIGYGDIAPNAPAAQSLAVGLGISGQIYLTVLVAMLVGKYLQDWEAIRRF